MSSQQELPDPPSDAITSVKWSSDGSALLVGSWDSHVRVYRKDPNDGSSFTLEHNIASDVPRLDVCWGKDGSQIVYVAGVDNEVRSLDLSSQEYTLLSSHGKPSNKIIFSEAQNILVSTSWDGTMHIHDPDSKAFIRVKLAAKPYALSLTTERLVVAMGERKVSIYDLTALRKLVEQTGNTANGEDVLELQPWQERESSLKFMTRAVACMPDGTGFATSSIEGRVGVEWFDPELQNNTYAFKCHRQTQTTQDEEGNEEEVDVVYPVNALAFHPSYGTFATGGGDGVVALWDAQTKRRVRLYHALGSSVAALDFSPDGNSIAIGVSPGFEDGREDQELDPSLVKLFVRQFAEGEAKAKDKKK